MAWNRQSQGMGVITPDRSTRPGRKIATVATSASRLPKARAEDDSKVAFLVDEGVVEIHDSRLFRAGREPFCRALVEEAIRPGRARRVEVRLASGSCRMEFEPGRFDRDAMAIQVAATLKAASSRSLDGLCEYEVAGTRWTTLTALLSDRGPSIRETLDAGDGRIIHRRCSSIGAPEISTHSGRRLRNRPRLVRREPPQARTLRGGRDLEPIRKRSLSLVEPGSSRLVNLALAGGSCAMAIAGVILPGIPSFPFLLLTGRYLIHSAPELCRRLEFLPGVPAMLHRVKEMGASVLEPRSLLKMLGVSVLAASVLLVIHPPLPLLILLEVGLFAFHGVREFQKTSNAPALAGPNRLSLA